MNRRHLLSTAASLPLLGLTNFSAAERTSAAQAQPFKISLAQWSLHRMLKAGKITNLEFPEFTAKNFGIDAVEYVSRFFNGQEKDRKYLGELRKRCADNDVKSLLIMCDGEGHLGDPDDMKRRQAVENHFKWVEAAQFLGCHAIRVNARSRGTAQDQSRLAADGLRQLSEFAAKAKINVIVENHGGLSGNGRWLAGTVKATGRANCGTLPDFGNFGQYDRYRGIRELMPFAKGLSAKSHDFNEAGEELHTDFYVAMLIALDASYKGYVGIEYEGKRLSEVDGIRKTKALLEKVRQLS